MGEIRTFVPTEARDSFSREGNLALQPMPSLQNQPERKLSVVTPNFREEIEVLRRKCDQSGIQRSERGIMQNYDFVTARWGYDRCDTKEQQERFRENELNNVVTALKERNDTVESNWVLQFTPEGKIYNPGFSEESWEVVLERGIAYRKSEGSQDIKREEAELAGFLQIQETFGKKETPLGTKFVAISPPSTVENTPYVKNFVDIFELQEDSKTKERRIACTRFASEIETSRYGEIVDTLSPQLSQEKGSRDDAWYLTHPIQVAATAPYINAESLFAKHFAKDSKGMEAAEFQELYKLTLPFILYYLDQLTSPEFDPIKTAEAWNTVLHSTENKELREHAQETTLFTASGTNELDEETQRKIHGYVQAFGRKEVKEVKAGCGSSSGVTIGGGGGILGNSVSQFGLQKGGGGGSEQEWFSCPECHYKANGPVGNSCPGCHLTKDAYAEKTGISC